MKQIFCYLLLPFTLLLGFTACDRAGEPAVASQAPEIIAITAVDASGNVLATPTHTVSGDKSVVDVTTAEAYALAIDIKLPSAEPKALVKSGSPWLSVSKATKERDELVRFVVRIAANESEDGRVGSIDFVNATDPTKMVSLLITQRGAGATPGSVPVILAVEAVNGESGMPLSEPKHKTQSPYTTIEVETAEAYYLNLRVESHSSPADIVVVSGSDWLRAELLKEESESIQTFRVSLSASQLTTKRYGQIRLFNKKDPSKHLIVNLVQKEGATPAQPKSAPVITSVTGVSMPDKKPLAEQKHTGNAPFGFISVETPESYTLLFALSCSNKVELSNEDHATWLTLGKVEAGANEGEQTFTVTLSKNSAAQSRLAKVKLFNSEEPTLSLLVTIQQSGSGAASAEQPALNYLAKWCIDRDGAFIKSTMVSENQKGLFNWDTAIGILPASGKSIEGHTYVMPTKDQWMSILPNTRESGSIKALIRFDEDIDFKNCEETVVVKNRTITSQNDYYGRKGANVVYAIRFKGDENQYSAWRYSKGGGILSIKQLLIPKGAGWTMADIANEAFWESHSDGTISRELVLAGMGNWNGSEITQPGEIGYFWTCTEDSEDATWVAKVTRLAYTDNFTFKTLRINVIPYQIDL